MNIKNAYWDIMRSIKMRTDPFPHWKYADKHHGIFIHIPKTAGTSILNAIGAYKRVHIDYSIYELSNPEKFRKYYKFCFVRNPWDRAVSTYFYLQQGGAGKTDLFFKDLLNNKYNTFESFVMDYLDEYKIHEHVLLKPQYLYIYNIQGQCQVDFVGRLENIDHDFSVIAKQLRINNTLKKINASKRDGYKQYYSDQTIEKISFLYKKDIELFNYQF